MRVSQRLDYSLRTLVLLAGQPEGSHVAAGDLAQRLNLPKRFVEQQVTNLAHAGLVNCRRGASGGCALARPADEISVRDVVLAVHHDILDVPRQRESATAELWDSAASALESHLAQVSVAELVKRQEALDQRARSMYYI